MDYDKPDRKNYVRGRKKSSGKAGLIIAIIVIVAALSGIGGFYVYSATQKKEAAAAEKAKKALEEAGYLCKLTDVIGVEVEDKVGNLNALLQALSESNINVNYIYLSFNRDSGKPVMVLQTEDISSVESCIVGKGFRVV